MFLIGLLLSIFVLVYLLITNNDRKAIYIFGLVSIAYFIFGYGIPLNELGQLVANLYVIDIVEKLIIIAIVFKLIEKFEDTLFPEDYSLILRSFFFRYETITLALFLIGILFSTGSLFTDFLFIVAIVRLFKVDEFMSYVIVTATLFYNGIAHYQTINIEQVTYNSAQFSEVSTHISEVSVLLLAILMFALYFSGYLVRSLEKDIELNKNVLLIILISTFIGILGINVLDTSTIVVYMSLTALVLLYLNDMNVRKRFSRYRNFPITYSTLLLFAFLMGIGMGSYSLIMFLILMFFVNAIVMMDNYKSDTISYTKSDTFRVVMVAITLIFICNIMANNSHYNTVEMGVPFISYQLSFIYDSITHIFARTLSLYTIAPYFNVAIQYTVPETVSYASSMFLTIAMPMLFVLSVPMQLLIINATKYRSKTSVEVVTLAIIIGLILVTMLSYGLGV